MIIIVGDINPRVGKDITIYTPIIGMEQKPQWTMVGDCWIMFRE